MKDASETLIGIFTTALELEAPARDAYLDEVCEPDSGLREGVLSLLVAHERAGEFLLEGVSMRHAEPVAIGEGVGDVVGKYKLVEPIGEGGCGVVFRAEQGQPVRREVALKVVKPGMDTRSVIAQFESERQALAMMEHPHIAQVYDAGATAAGRPYFVMELVRGEKITAYCERHGLTLRARLELFVQVCHAIQHAHQKGIIHRDIKPSNILVATSGEGTPLPKVIDFGIAKATTGLRLTDKTLFTTVEMLIGTPTYMSPEQAVFGSPDVDTRTDIYSLGVLLYELLAGAPPFDVQGLLKGGLDEVRRAILNKEPVRPSARLKMLPSVDLTAAARQRQMEPARLVRALRGDLDWIVMKALEKDRSRRYPTANALAMDVQRYLADEPVVARPPGTLYQLGKLVVRNRLLVGGLTVIALLLVGSLAVVTVLLARERAARGQAEIEKRTANLESTKNEQVGAVLRKMMSGLTIEVAKKQDAAVLRELLARTDREISSDPSIQLEVEASLRSVLGDSYRDLGDLAAAERMFRRTLEVSEMVSPPDRRDIANSATLLANVLIDEKKYEEADRHLRSAGDLWRELGGEEKGSAVTMENLAVLRSRQGRNEEAEDLMQRVLAWRRKNLPPDDPELVSALSNLAVVAHGAGKFAESERIFREALDARPQLGGEDQPGQARTLLNLYQVISQQGRADEAKEYLTRAVDIYRKHFEPRNPTRVQASSWLADLQCEAGALGEAETLYREVIANGGHTAKDYSKLVDGAIGCLAVMLYDQGRTAEADAVFDQVLTPEFAAAPQCAPVLEMRVEFRARAGRWREAVADASRLVEIAPEKQDYYHKLAALLVAAGDEEGYRKLCAEMLKRFAGTKRAAMDCLILPGAVSDLTAVVESAPAGWKALAELRAGNFNAALETRDASEPMALAVRAMALQHLDRKEEARVALAEGSAAFEKLPKPGAGPLVKEWRDWIVARALLEEAR